MNHGMFEAPQLNFGAGVAWAFLLLAFFKGTGSLGSTGAGVC
jgi:hypothetical protein